MKKKSGQDKQDKNKKLIAVRMSPRALQLLEEFTDKYPGMSQSGMLEVGLLNLKKATEADLKELFFEFIQGIKK
jgi:hypothetical protein